jgi:hypothetical protein
LEEHIAPSSGLKSKLSKKLTDVVLKVSHKSISFTVEFPLEAAHCLNKNNNTYDILEIRSAHLQRDGNATLPSKYPFLLFEDKREPMYKILYSKPSLQHLRGRLPIIANVSYNQVKGYSHKYVIGYTGNT